MSLRKSLSLCAFLVAATISTSEIAYADAKKIGVVGSSNPSLSAKGTNGDRVLKINEPIYFEETITTDAGGNAQIIFLDHSALTVGPNSSVTIDKFVYDPEKSTGELAISSTKGTLRFIGGALSKKDAVKITTPVSTIGIRGGIAMVNTDAKTGASDATFVYGHEMTVSNDLGTVSTTQPGNMVNVSSANTPPSPPVPADVTQLASNMTALAPASGTNGGAKVVPTSEGLKQDLKQMDNTVHQNEQSSNSNEATAASNADNKSDGAAADKNTSDGTSEGDGNSSSATSTEASASPAAKNDAPAASPLAPAGEAPSPISTAAAPPSAPPAANLNFAPPVPNLTTSEVASTATSVREKIASGGCAGTSGSALCDRARDAFGGSIPTSGTAPTSNTTITVITPPIMPPVSNIPPTAGTGSTNASTSTASNNTVQSVMFDGLAYYSGEYNGTVTDEKMAKIDAPDNYTWNQSTIPSLNFVFDNDGTKTASNLPVASNGSYTFISGTPITIAGDDFTGKTFASANGFLHWYDLNHTDGSDVDELKILTGRVADSSNYPTTGLAVYDALPAFNFRSSDATATTRYGIVDYNIYNYNNLPGIYGSFTSAALGTPGVIVDWSKNRFIAVNIDFSYIDSTTYSNRVFVSFGSISPSEDAVLKGLAYDMYAKNDAGSISYDFNSNPVTSLHRNVFGGTVGGAAAVDGFILTAADTGVNNITTARQQGFIVDANNNSSLKSNINMGTNQTTDTLKGYAAGVYTRNKDSAPTQILVWNDQSGGVEISNDGANINGKIDVFSVNGVGNAPTAANPSITADFGIHNAAGAPSAYIANNLYAAKQSGAGYNDGSTIVYSSNTNGFIVAGGAAIAPSVQCSSCDFAHWGVWASDIRAIGTSERNDGAYMIPYVAGKPTTSTEFETYRSGSPANGVYTGPTIGQIVNGSNIANATGTFQATVNFGSRSVHLNNLSIGGLGGTIITGGTVTMSANQTAFSNMVAGTSSGFNAVANGAFYGPQANNMAGNFKFTDTGTSASGTGVFLGAR